ncbi:MAG: sigma-54-dependent Fis family transcriptional regulator [Cyclobacteriaceae bacterium]|nr:sigma-54-dependent Fis family transcriptional regulator [Cyclobacteriaceae bacterium]
MEAKKGRILIVDDNEEFLIALKILLTPYFQIIVTESVPDRMLTLLKRERFDVILLDMNFRAGIQSGNEGFYWMQKIREMDEEVTVLFITAYGDVEVAINAMKEGAADFIQKSWDEQKIISTVMSAYRLSRSKKEVNRLKSGQHLLGNTIEKDFYFVEGESAVMKNVYDLIDKVSVTDASVLITGESGTGKEVIARQIHKRSLRSGEIFVSVDLGALQQSLFESELFGHIKGAFTDAREDRPGRFEIASGGTIFLDEIGNLPINLQPKLLKVLQNRRVSRIGENHEREIDFRLISATNMSLPTMIRERSFREDLLYRIRTVEIEMPPLRKRTEDIPVLANHFLRLYAEKYKKQISFSDQAINKLMKFEWPGNVRELQHAIEKAVILTSGSRLQSADFQLEDHFQQSDKSKYSYNLEENEREIILNALTAFEWNMSKTAKELGINRSTLYDKIKKYELKPV